MMKYSIVIPVYNSEHSLEELFRRICETMNSLEATYEVICVNDFSRDKSWGKLEALKLKNPDILKIISLSKNFGQHSAIFCGFTYAKGKYILTIDDDLQHAPEDMLHLIDEIENGDCEVVYGISKADKITYRRFLSWLWYFVDKIFDNSTNKGSAFRILNDRVKKGIVKHSQGVIFIDEIIKWHTTSIGFVNVSHHSRKYGASNYNSIRLFNFITKVSFSYSTVPLRLMSLVGGGISFLSFLLGVYFIFKKIYFGVSVQGFTALIVAILFSSSLILLGIGLLGRYLNQIFILLNNKPSYSVEKEDL